nr:DUF5687 family protein [Paraflavitalea speifideiaquila]
MLSLMPFYLGLFIIMVVDHKTGHGPNLIFLSFLAGFFPALYGQFVFSWESACFDGIMTRPGSFSQYVAAKYYLMLIMILISFIPVYIALSFTTGIDTLLLFSLGLFSAGVTCF